MHRLSAFRLFLALAMGPSLCSCSVVFWDNPIAPLEESIHDPRIPGAWRIPGKDAVVYIGKPVDGWVSFAFFPDAPKGSKEPFFGKAYTSRVDGRTFLNRGNSVVLMGLPSKMDPMISPAMAPSIFLRVLVMETVNFSWLPVLANRHGKNLVHPSAVHVYDLETHISPLKELTDMRNASHLADDKTPYGLIKTLPLSRQFSEVK